MARPPRFDPAAARRRLQQAQATASAEGPRTATDHLVLDPEEIVLSGPYVRQHVDPAELESLRQAIVAGGEVKQAVGVRMEGTPLEPRYVLVYGMRRWLASKEAGLPRIPVRNHGRISVLDSLALQVTENEARVDPHPVDTAVSYQLLVQDGGLSQAAVARLAARSAAHVSYMRAVGEAILQLAPEEREALYSASEATVPRFQKIAPLRTVAERVGALRALVDRGGVGEEARRAAPRVTRFHAGPSRRDGTWALRVSYRDEDVRRDPELAAHLESFLEEQLDRLRAVAQRSRAAPGDTARRPVMWEIEEP